MLSNTHPLKTLLISGILALFLMPVPSSGAAVEQSVHALRQAGWTLVDKAERDEWHPGVYPYEKLRRQVYVVTYTLEKDGRSMTCILARDVMYDTFEQSCQEAE